ncbi:hypothetical protein [Pseudogemmobacter sonorensis]|uniref:hypothetical protein n=1 Tax=Pseudogemmobacter sonorensis TaxID=2989681 RepID=UPI0036C46916
MEDPAIPAGWEGILDPGERILWQGRPEAGFDWSALISTRTPFGLAFAGFAIFWMSMTRITGGAAVSPFFMGVLFPLFGLPFLFAGLNIAFGKPLRDFLRQRGSHYTLTNRHAFIATDILGKRTLSRHPIGAGFRPALEEGDPGSVWFGTRAAVVGHVPYKDETTGFGQWLTRTDRIGFERIREARRAWRMMLDQATANAARQGAETEGGTAR